MQLDTIAAQIVLLPVELNALALELHDVHTTPETTWKVFGVYWGSISTVLGTGTGVGTVVGAVRITLL